MEPLRSQVNILNFTFTIINDIENAMSVNGNYVLGKNILKRFNQEYILEYYKTNTLI